MICQSRPNQAGKIHVLREKERVWGGKVHNCFINDWKEMKADERVDAKIAYDAWQRF